MSQTSEQLIVVVDAGPLIAMKGAVKLSYQWAVGLAMTELVRNGSLHFPKQVAEELANIQHPDTPGAWTQHAKHCRTQKEPADETLREVFAEGQLIDPESEKDQADPYVIAMALELDARYDGAARIVVATTDVRDHPPRVSVATVCGRLGIGVMSVEEFYGWVRE